MHPTTPVCPPPAHQRPGDSLAAPAEEWQVVRFCLKNPFTLQFTHPIGEWLCCCGGAFLVDDVFAGYRA